MSDSERMATTLELQESAWGPECRSPQQPWKMAPTPLHRSNKLLQEHDKNCLKPILPIKYGRMLESPFAFMRGAAVVMALTWLQHQLQVCTHSYVVMHTC